MRKWTITGLLVVALATLGFYARTWLPHVLPLLRNHENADLLKSITSLVQISLWLTGALAFVVRLWRPNKKAQDVPSSVVGTTQTGAVNVGGGELKVYGDLVGRDRIEGDAVAGDKVAGDKYVLPALPIISALHQLPAPPADFTGRADELKELLTAVKTGGVTISGLRGLGGVGKTALALKLAEQLKAGYPDAQFYLDLKGVTQPLTPRDAMAYIVRAWHPTAQLPEKEEELAPIYRSVLDRKRVLLLMDNARDAQQVAPLIPPAVCLLLVTSRKHFTLPGLVEKNLDKLPAADACELLQRIAPRLKKEKMDQIDELARLCGYLPLALRAVGSALHEKRNISPSDYGNRLSDTRQRLKLTETEAALLSSYELLSDDSRLKFRCLAVFPDTFDHAAAADIWAISQEAAQDLLGELLSYSLIEFDEILKRYALHDLVHLFASQLLSSEESNNIQKRHAGHYLEIISAAETLYKKGGASVILGLALFDTEWANILAGYNRAVARLQSEDGAAEYCALYPLSGANCLSLRQHPRERIRWLELALASARRLQRQELEGYALGNLAAVYGALGEYDRAIEYAQQRLGHAQKCEDRLGEATATGNLGSSYYQLRDYRKAVENHLRHLQLSREIKDREGEVRALGNLGAAYNGLGEQSQALQYTTKGIELAREIGNYRSAALILTHLAKSYADLGEPHRAIEYADQSLKIAREMGDHWVEGLALFNSAVSLDQLGNRPAAIDRAEAALKILEAIESPFAANARAHLAKWRGEDKASGKGSA